MATIKINPAKLPYRGEPTKDRQPKPWTIPDDVKVIKVESKAMQTTHEAWKKKQAVHNKRGGKKNNANNWSQEEIDKVMELYWQGVDYADIAKAVGRTESATRTRITLVRKARELKERKIPGRPGANK